MLTEVARVEKIAMLLTLATNYTSHARIYRPGGENAIPKASPSPVVESVNDRNGSTFPLASRAKTMTEPGAEKGDGFVITKTSPVWRFPASP